jgi:hypothetical protein
MEKKKKKMRIRNNNDESYRVSVHARDILFQVIRGLDLVHGLLFEDFTARFPGCLWGWAIAEAIVEKVPFFNPPQNQLVRLDWTHYLIHGWLSGSSSQSEVEIVVRRLISNKICRMTSHFQNGI